MAQHTITLSYEAEAGYEAQMDLLNANYAAAYEERKAAAEEGAEVDPLIVLTIDQVIQNDADWQGKQHDIAAEARLDEQLRNLSRSQKAALVTA